jgi:hypothetical protein
MISTQALEINQCGRPAGVPRKLIVFIGARRPHRRILDIAMPPVRTHAAPGAEIPTREVGWGPITGPLSGKCDGSSAMVSGIDDLGFPHDYRRVVASLPSLLLRSLRGSCVNEIEASWMAVFAMGELGDLAVWDHLMQSLAHGGCPDARRDGDFLRSHGLCCLQ